MANVAFEYKILRNAPDEQTCEQLGSLSAAGWELVGTAYGDGMLICILRREKDFEVAQSLREAFEQTTTVTDAIAQREIPPEEIV